MGFNRLNIVKTFKNVIETKTYSQVIIQLLQL